MENSKYPGRCLILVLLLLLGFTRLFGQQRPYTIHIEDHYFVINPAATALGNYMISGLSLEQPAQQYKGEIQTGRLYLQRPILENQISLGAFLFHDRSSYWSQSQIMATMAYQLPLNWPSRKGILSLGLAVGTTNFASKWPEFIVNSNIDPVLPESNINRWEFNSGAGLMYISSNDYHFEGYYIGISIQPLARRVLDLTINSSWQESYYANAIMGANWHLGNEFVLQSSGWLDWTLLYQLRPGVKLGIEKFHHYWAGLGYSTSGTATVEAGYAFLFNEEDPLRLSLTYFTQTGELSSAVQKGLSCQVSFRYLIF